MKTAQDYVSSSASGEFRGGFNSRLFGDSRLKSLSGVPKGYYWAERSSGWEKANQMILNGEIFSRKNGVEFKCYQDGNKWCCIGAEFINLQESGNYTFADTREEAINEFIGLPND